MVRSRKLAAVFTLAALGLAPPGCGSGTRSKGAGEPVTTVDHGATGDPLVVHGSTRTAVEPRPIGDVVDRGLAWLAAHQLEGGGWGQGDEAPTMGNGMAAMRDKASVADTSMALLAFVRAGNTPNHGRYRDQVDRGLAFVLSEIEASDRESLYVSDVRGTRVQAKIGPYADTFAALLVLSEVRGKMRDGVANARLDRALNKVVAKIERNQREDGTWDGQGWAPVLSQALASKGLNRAAQNGIKVADAVLDRVEQQAHAQVDLRSYTFDADAAAGVQLYQGAAASAATRDTAVTKKAKAVEMKARASGAAGKEMKAPDAPTAAEVAAAEASAARSEFAADEVEGALLRNLDDEGFRGGFGNNGGEEFLSYLLISESLVAKGGAEWDKWNTAITALVDGVQNEDGSWTGHHCITGRTFCTAAALLVLLADRTPVPDAIAAS